MLSANKSFFFGPAAVALLANQKFLFSLRVVAASSRELHVSTLKGWNKRLCLLAEAAIDLNKFANAEFVGWQKVR
jgi:hypothetical protein